MSNLFCLEKCCFQKKCKKLHKSPDMLMASVIARTGDVTGRAAQLRAVYSTVETHGKAAHVSS